MIKFKKLSIGLFILFFIGILGYNYVMHGGARDVSSEETEFTTTAKSITNEFVSATEKANKKYLEKAVAVSGKITSISKLEVILDNTVICNLQTNDTTIKQNKEVTIKGRIVGFDDLMGEVKLDQCHIIKK